jgi:prepilin-type N-terminal cleavage/methylation domain-containing protein
MMNKCEKNYGFTLIEAMIAMVLLSIAAAGLLLPFNVSASVQQEGAERTLAARLTGDLIEQIQNTDFAQIVSTYGNYIENSGSVKDAQGVVFTGPLYARFSRKAKCEYIYTAQQDGLDTPNFIRIKVQVFYNGSKMSDVTTLKSK